MHGRPVCLAAESKRNVMNTNNDKLLSPFWAVSFDSVDAGGWGSAKVAEGTDGFCSPHDGNVDALL